MTIEEIRESRIEAEAQILAVLAGLREKTGLCPVEVAIRVLTFNRVGATADDNRPSTVHIKFERI
jgi:hypothetical protein